MGLGREEEMRNRELNWVLGLKDYPNPLLTQEDLGECYLGLYNHMLTKYDGGWLTRSHAMDLLEILEFQSSWHVLRRFETDETIEVLSDYERHKKFLGKLYSERGKFPDLFRERERAVEDMAENSLITFDDYVIREETPRQTL